MKGTVHMFQLRPYSGWKREQPKLFLYAGMCGAEEKSIGWKWNGEAGEKSTSVANSPLKYGLNVMVNCTCQLDWAMLCPAQEFGETLPGVSVRG